MTLAAMSLVVESMIARMGIPLAVVALSLGWWIHKRVGQDAFIEHRSTVSHGALGDLWWWLLCIAHRSHLWSCAACSMLLLALRCVSNLTSS